MVKCNGKVTVLSEMVGHLHSPEAAAQPQHAAIPNPDPSTLLPRPPSTSRYLELDVGGELQCGSQGRVEVDLVEPTLGLSRHIEDRGREGRGARDREADRGEGHGRGQRWTAAMGLKGLGLRGLGSEDGWGTKQTDGLGGGHG